MHLYLVRHGEAKPEVEDPARPLSNHGRVEVEAVARHAAALGVAVTEICHSGKLRARQTAEILAAHIKPRDGTREMKGLAPGDDPEIVQAYLEAVEEPLMLVGHLPHLGRLASALLLGDPAREILDFEAGAILCLIRAGQEFHIQWLLTPQLARVLRSRPR